MRLSGIYEILNTVNGKFYIGSAVDLKARFRTHIRALKRNCHINKHLQNAFNKYGAEAFIVFPLEYCKPKELISKEQFWLSALKATEAGYNICPTAGSVLGLRHSDETKRKISRVHKGKTVTFSAEHRDNISKALTGKKLSDEHRQALRDGHKGKKRGPLSEETKRKIGEATKKRWADKEYKDKVRRALKGRKPSPGSFKKGYVPTDETREKLRTSHLGQSPSSTSFKKGHVPWNKGNRKTRGPVAP